MRKLLVSLAALVVLFMAASMVRAAGPSSDPTASPDVFHPLAPLATAQCHDGWFSYSQTVTGTCDGHGGVMVWINQPTSGQPVVTVLAPPPPPPALPPDAGLSIHVPPPGILPPNPLFYVLPVPFPPVFEPPYPFIGPGPSFIGGLVCPGDQITAFALDFCGILQPISGISAPGTNALGGILFGGIGGCISFSGGPCVTLCNDGQFSSSLPGPGVCSFHGGIAP